MGGGLGRDETHDMARRMELHDAGLISTETRKIRMPAYQVCNTAVPAGELSGQQKVDCVMDAQELVVQTRVFLDRPSGR